LINSSTYEFDVFIRSTGSSFQLTSYQCTFTFNYYNIVNGGSLSFSFIPGSSELGNPPSLSIGINTSNGVRLLTFASMPGSDNIVSTAKRVGHFRLQNTSSFSGGNPNILWNFGGNMATILTDSNFTNITVPSNHISELGIPNKLQIIQVTASAIANITNGPEKTIDGLGYNDSDVNSLWTAIPTPQHLIYDLGYLQMVSLTKFSFCNFNCGRVYQYSIFLSNDQINWTEVVSNVSSGLNEWTENQFTPKQARYVKLLLLSNSENNLATVWETEVWGYSNPTPVELVSFTANVLNNQIHLNWSTASEINNKGFEVHRSKEGINQVIGYVEGKGSSSEVNSYSFTDESELESGRYSYRLKQIDYDGTSEYSDEARVEIVEKVKEYALLQNYPNPFNPITKIRFHLPEEEDVLLTVYNSVGEQVANLVKGRLTSGSHEIEFNAGDFASGVYFYQLNAGNYTDIKKMIVMR